jgi:hypothetical protein
MALISRALGSWAGQREKVDSFTPLAMHTRVHGTVIKPLEEELMSV